MGRSVQCAINSSGPFVFRLNNCKVPWFYIRKCAGLCVWWPQRIFDFFHLMHFIVKQHEFPAVVHGRCRLHTTLCLSDVKRQAIVSTTLIARFMGPTWGPRGDDRTQVGPMLAPQTLISGNDELPSLRSLWLTLCKLCWYPHTCVFENTLSGIICRDADIFARGEVN